MRFFEQYHVVLDAVTHAVIQEHRQSKWLVDLDVLEVFKCLKTTMKTLSNGIYYELLPDGPTRLSLFRRLKGIFDELMQPDPSAGRNILKATETIEVLDFLTFVAQGHSSIRPKSRRYLDWVAEKFADRTQTQSSGIILP